MKRKKQLSDIAEIRFGINVREGASAEVPCVMAKDFDRAGRFKNNMIYKISRELVKDRDWLEPGLILFNGKGQRHFAVVWEGWVQKAVASSTFFVISPKSERVDRHYLAWYLNSKAARRYFQRDIKVTTINTISRKQLERLPVVLPDTGEQRQIVKIWETWQREKQLMRQWTEKMEYYINAILDKKINEKA